MTRRRLITMAAATSLVVSAAAVVLFGRLAGLPYLARHPEWAIAVYTGTSPFHLSSPAQIRNPVIMAGDVTDVPAAFVADPFMVRQGGTWHLFFEVMNGDTAHGDIGLATSPDGVTWAYRQIVLDEAFHLSYPCVFEWQGAYYMTPESHQARAVRLYRAREFPFRWAFVGTLLEGRDYVDPSVVRHDGRWWIFVGTNAKRHDTLRLYYADDLLGRFTEHPQSPIVAGDATRARPAGRVRPIGGRLIRFAQNDEPTYGNQVRAFEITTLSTAAYAEREIGESPILTAGESGWNARGMHHIDPHRVEDGGWIACVDGYRRPLVIRLRR